MLPSHNKTLHTLIIMPKKWVDQVRHLGNTVQSNLSELPDCKIKCSTLTGSVNKLSGDYKGLNHMSITVVLSMVHNCEILNVQD